MKVRPPSEQQRQMHVPKRNLTGGAQAAHSLASSLGRCLGGRVGGVAILEK